MNRLGLIAGNGKFPIMAAIAAKQQGINIIAIAFVGETSIEIAKHVTKIYWIRIGELGKLFDIFKKESIFEAIMAGQIRSIHLFKPWLKKDSALKDILKKVKDKRGDSLLDALAMELNVRNIKLLDSSFLLKDCLAPKGLLTQRKPTDNELGDIEFAKKIAKEMARLAVGQTIVVKNKAILAVESIEGTDAAIKRAAKLGGPHAVVVKVSKPNHDMRFDIPVIGLKTLKILKKSRIKVIAIEAQKTLLIDKEELINRANKLGVTILAFEV
ncbi:MAG: UDP-2,3-diacylglucosamine diphosphatase LpxI [Candidatus Kappaea frigidicola]|nr:UDP-2,3-diacylglucosamine diphosphatase LpxI [Candidatus Kappaea frigidicola]